MAETTIPKFDPVAYKETTREQWQELFAGPATGAELGTRTGAVERCEQEPA